MILSLASLWAMWLAIETGFSRQLSAYGSVSNLPGAVNEASRLTPGDPEAHTLLGLLLSQNGEYGAAAVEFERAAELRPRDYYLWLELGMARDQLGDQDGAERALRESVRLAPFYARPAWQYGNLLFRMGRRNEAFRELRRAVKSEPSLLPAMIDLAWAALGNADAVREVLQPQSALEHVSLARFFAKHGKGPEAVADFRAAGTTSREDVHDVIGDLLAQKAFREAHELWAIEHSNETTETDEEGSLTYDGGFEKALEVNEPGFGWQVSQNIPSVSLSLDPFGAYQGAKSLKVDFNGDSNPATSAISQLSLVDPGSRYRLRFSARTQDLISGGLPMFVVSDANAPNVSLAQSEPLGSGNNPWREAVLDFTTGPQTNVVLLSVRRKPCTTGPCPIFGSLWLDAIFLRRT